MGTPRQLTQIAFAAPLDESTEDEVLDASVGFPVLENVRQDKRGGVSKRYGFDPLPSTTVGGSARTEGRRCFSHVNDACVIGGRHVYAYSSAIADNVDCGTVPDCSVEVRPLPASVSNLALTQHDQVVCNGFVILAYGQADQASSSGFAALVTSAADGRTIRHDRTFLSGTQDPIFQVGAYGTTAFIVASNITASTMSIYKLDCTSATTVAAGWTTVTSGVTSKSTSSGVLSLQSLSDRIAIAFIASTGSGRCIVRTFNAAGIIDTFAVNTSSTTPDNVAVEGRTGGRLYVCWNEGTNVKIVGLDPNSLSTNLVVAATVLTGGLNSSYPPSLVSDATTGGSIIAFAGDQRVRTNTWTAPGAAFVFAGQDNKFGATPVSRGTRLADSRTVSLFQVDSVGSQEAIGNVILGDWTYLRRAVLPLATAYPNRSSVDTASHFLTMPDGRLGYITCVSTTAASKSYALVLCDFFEIERWRNAYHNGSTFLTSGVLSYYTGDQVQEASFLHAPRNLDVVPDSSGVGPGASVTYVAVFESLDGAGNLTQSGVSTPFAYSGTGVRVFPQCEPLLLTMRSVVRVTLYRTKTSGKTYYRVDSRDALDYNIISFVDSKDDTALAFEPLLYGTGVLPGTYGGPLQREAPPYCRDVVSFNGMLVVASGSDLWWSGQTIGGEGTWFSTEQFSAPIDGEGGITALAAHDGTLYVFKERAIWVVPGEAPADNGSAGGLGTPRRLAGDVGCIQTNSVVVTSYGIFFLSHRGIELLGRGGSSTWVGEKVQRTLAAFPVVTSAKLDARNNVIRFSLGTGVTDGLIDPPTDADDGPGVDLSGGGRGVVFDLVMNDWQSVDIMTGTTALQPAQDACIANVDGEDRYAWLATDGLLYVETNGWRDNGAWITMAAETGWFKVAGIQGRQIFENMLVLARKHDDLNLSVSLGYDYALDFEASRTWTAAELTSLLTTIGWPITQLRHDGSNNAEGQAVRVRIEDSSPDEGGARGATWLALTLNITPKEGPAEVPAEAA